MVITSLVGSIPGIGPDLLFLLWGGFSIEDATLHRFYSLHFFLPFVMLFILSIHFFFLHEQGSNNPLGFSDNTDMIDFYPYYVYKDILGLVFVLFIFFFVVYISPDLLGHVDNFDKANFLVTPAHIVPE